jgi:multiple sugar transport system permease protein
MAGRAVASPTEVGREVAAGAPRAGSAGEVVRRLPDAALQGGAYLLLTAWALLAVVPVYWMVASAFKAQTDNLTVPPQWIPDPVVLDNFRALFRNAYIGRWFVNSLVVAVAITALQLLFNSMAGYAFAKLRFPGRMAIFWGLMATLMVPGLVTLIPLFIMFSNFKLLDTYWVLVLPHAVSIWGIFLMKQFMQTLPSSLFDAARIDACSEFGIYWKIVLPLAKPGLAVLAIFTFVAEWNSFFWWLLFTNSQAMRNLQVGLTYYRYENQIDWGPIMAGTVIAALPVIAVFFAFQRYFLRGLTIGALKG